MLKIIPGVNPSSLDLSRDAVRGEVASPPPENLGSDHPSPEVLVRVLPEPGPAPPREHVCSADQACACPHAQPRRPPARAGPPQHGLCTPRRKPWLLTSDAAFPLSPQAPHPHVHCAYLAVLPFHLAIIKEGREDAEGARRETMCPSPHVGADITLKYTAGKWTPA